MVECDRIPYMNLVDWVVYNLRVYAVEGGGSESLWLAVTLFGDYAWDKIMRFEGNGKSLAEILIEGCIRDPFTRDEDEWDEYMRCIEEKLWPLLKQLEPGLIKIEKGLEQAIKKLRIEGDQ